MSGSLQPRIAKKLWWILLFVVVPNFALAQGGLGLVYAEGRKAEEQQEESFQLMKRILDQQNLKGCIIRADITKIEQTVASIDLPLDYYLRLEIQQTGGRIDYVFLRFPIEPPSDLKDPRLEKTSGTYRFSGQVRGRKEWVGLSVQVTFDPNGSDVAQVTIGVHESGRPGEYEFDSPPQRTIVCPGPENDTTEAKKGSTQ